MIRATAKIPGTTGLLYDWRGTGMCPPVRSGGRTVKIGPVIMVEHIPVVRNVVGPGDFHTLANVLKAQGLSLQAATDAEGNVCFYANLNDLCWQARGANQVSCGVEHMHWSTSEPWTRKQFLASAWLWHHAWKNQGIPCKQGTLFYGAPGVATVTSPGHVSHELVSRYAGYNDRTDPGDKYDWQLVRKAALYFRKHGTFKGF
jgi:hypothetical protein